MDLFKKVKEFLSENFFWRDLLIRSGATIAYLAFIIAMVLMLTACGGSDDKPALFDSSPKTVIVTGDEKVAKERQRHESFLTFLKICDTNDGVADFKPAERYVRGGYSGPQMVCKNGFKVTLDQ